ncbi:unnamed protein product [Lymnaea stagnalis]|uniref:BMERB domain-containing protein n=1 Tax=Lymnaea stagnalis TaxID=6523 RepID=A0AAV2ID16_LYMST
MGTRPDDPSMTPSQQRKRPLSIIQEYDSDDAGVPEVILDLGDVVKTKLNAKENSNKDGARHGKGNKAVNGGGSLPGEPQTPNQTKSHSPSPGKSKHSTKKNPPKDASAKPPKSTTAAPPKSINVHHDPPSPSSDIKTPAWKKKKNRKSASKHNGAHVGSSSPTGLPLKPFQERAPASSPPPPARLQHDEGKRTPEAVAKNKPDALTNGDAVTIPVSSAPKIVADGYGLARIRETAERLNLTSTSPPSPLPSLSHSPKFSHRLRLATATTPCRPLSEGAALMGVTIPQITITPSAGTGRLAPDTAAADRSPDTDPENLTTRLSPILSRRLPYLTSKYSSSKFGSSFFNRRVRSDSSGSLSEGELSEGSNSVIDSSEDTPYLVSDFKRLKETTEKLQLSPRRPSIMLWRQKYMEGSETRVTAGYLNGDVSEERLTTDRKQRINEALDWLKNELQEMRSQDQTLARQLLTIRQDIHQLKLQRCTAEHQDLIDDYQSEMEDLHELSYVLDIPQPLYGNNPLKHIGVTRLNLSARRFSAC